MKAAYFEGKCFCVCCSFVLKLAAAAECLQSYLDHADRPVAGTTYSALHDLVQKIDASHCLTAAVVPPVDSETNQQSVSSEPDECQLIFLPIPSIFSEFLIAKF